MSTMTLEDVRTLQETIVWELPRWIEEEPIFRRRLMEVLIEAPPQVEVAGPALPRMTYEEFLAWADEDTLAEWVDGEVVMYSPASDRHQDISGFLESVLRSFVEARQLGVVRSAPFQMKLERGREPDLLFVASEHLDRLLETRLEGPADMVVEIISEGGLGRDRGEKFEEYETAGITEYWLLNPLREWAEFYRLDGTGHYQMVFSGAEGIYRSEAVPGFWLKVEWLWQKPLPGADMVSWEILGYDNVVRRLAQAIGVEELRRLLDEVSE